MALGCCASSRAAEADLDMSTGRSRARGRMRPLSRYFDDGRSANVFQRGQSCVSTDCSDRRVAARRIGRPERASRRRPSFFLQTARHSLMGLPICLGIAVSSFSCCPLALIMTFYFDSVLEPNLAVYPAPSSEPLALAFQRCHQLDGVRRTISEFASRVFA